jgi:hypothetical protein
MQVFLISWRRLVVLGLAIAVGAWLAGWTHTTWTQALSWLAIVVFGAWTTPKTWTATVVTVVDLNTHIRDNLNVLKTSIDDAGHLIWPVFQSKTTTYGIAATDDIVVCPSGSFTVTLPTAVGRTGKPFVVKNMGTGTITMASTSSQTIDGLAASSTILVQYDSLTFVSDGANWVIT